MITTNLTGNLGNHMWQYASCRAIAETLGYDWGFNSIPSHDYYNGMNQMYFMDIDFGKPINNIQNEYHEPWKTIHHIDEVNINKYDPNIYNISDNTILLGKNGAIGGIFQSEQYILSKKTEILKWFSLNAEYVQQYQKQLYDLNILLDENTCIINFRGGEYRHLPTVLLRKEYWKDSINNMLSFNPKMKFITITDDPECAKNYMPFNMPIIHIDIGFDFYVVNQAKWVIISNSTFSWWAAWLNQKANKILAPKYWARHNVSNGYWSTGDSYTSCFDYVDRDGKLINYAKCKQEAIEHDITVHNYL